jgi:hypothetical protein
MAVIRNTREVVNRPQTSVVRIPPPSAIKASSRTTCKGTEEGGDCSAARKALWVGYIPAADNATRLQKIEDVLDGSTLYTVHGLVWRSWR